MYTLSQVKRIYFTISSFLSISFLFSG